MTALLAQVRRIPDVGEPAALSLSAFLQALVVVALLGLGLWHWRRGR